MAGRYLPLEEAAAAAGLSLELLALLEREELIEVKRTLEGAPVIAPREVERARLVALLTQELDVNLAGAEVILHMRDDMIAMQRQFDAILRDLVDELKRSLAGRRAERG
jgi:MerR family transcriptional regulator/heat shock protein HspR